MFYNQQQAPCEPLQSLNLKVPMTISLHKSIALYLNIVMIIFILFLKKEISEDLFIYLFI